MKNALVFPLFAVLLVAGCVTTGKYDAKVKEAESLAAQKSELEAKTKKLSDDLAAAAKEKEALQSKVEELSPKAQKAEQLEKASQTYADLIKKLEKEIKEGEVQITEMKNRLTVTMVDTILFPSGSAEVSKKGKAVLDKVVDILKDVKDKRIQVEGHTDNVKIVSSLKKRFPTNWELSTARATEVVRHLQDTGKIDPKLLSATGYGEFMPVADNTTDEGRHKNRRIEIVLLPLI
jgi:chemotaxis protein MotB